MATGQSELRIFFDPTQSETAEFLRQIEISEENIVNGYLPQSDPHTRFGALLAVATSDQGDRSVQGRLTLSNTEAIKGLRLITEYGMPHILSLFRYGACPGNGRPYLPQPPENFSQNHGSDVLTETVAIQMVSNLLDIPTVEHPVGVIPSLFCPYDPSLSIKEQTGVPYPKENVPAAISHAVKSVGMMTAGEGEGRDMNGGGVIVSRRGHLVTARHLLFRRDQPDKMKDRLLFEIGGRVISLKREHVVVDDAHHDLVLLKVPELVGLPHAEVNREPKLNEQIWLAGFPTIVLNLDRGTPTPIFTTGSVSKVSPRNDEEYLCVAEPEPDETNEAPFYNGYAEVTAKANYGYSGGPLFDSQGRLIAILSFKHAARTKVGFEFKAHLSTGMLLSDEMMEIICGT